MRGPSRVGEGCRARISGLSAGVAAWARGGGDLLSVAALVAMVTSTSWCDRCISYTIFAMGDRLLRGVPVTDEQIQAWADEAERGYDLAELPAPRPGRPPVGKGPGVAVTVRLDEQTLKALMERAALEGIGSRSDAIRAAVREWTHVA